jgi:hypothetical protein
MKVCPLVYGLHKSIDELWRCKVLNVSINDMATGARSFTPSTMELMLPIHLLPDCCLEPSD